jgi:thiosulfate dehydrogenase [quinone] large subunit
MATIARLKNRVIQDPPIINRLGSSPWAGLLWLPVRVWLGWQWIQSGLGKLSNPAWTQTGEALKGFWMNAVVIPETGRAPIAFDWYRGFIQAMIDAQAWTWFSKLVVAGELLVGVALVLGAFTGIAASIGGFMNWNFMMAGSASVNPLFFLISVGLLFAWKVSGYVGLDYFLVPRVAAIWRRPSEQSEARRTVQGGLPTPPGLPSK